MRIVRRSSCLLLLLVENEGQYRKRHIQCKRILFDKLIIKSDIKGCNREGAGRGATVYSRGVKRRWVPEIERG
jgi:hypothetical protein